MASKKDLIEIRDARKSDEAKIYKSILLGTYYGNKPGKGQKHDSSAPVDYFSSIDKDTFMKEYHGFLEHMLNRPGTVVRIACLVANQDVILGFSIIRGDTLHFVFISPDWRRIGLATDLVPRTVTTVSGFTRVGDIIRRKKGLVFNPWA